MLWLVDGMNVIGSRPDGWWRDRTGAQRRLAEELAAWAGRSGEQVAVVFDGRPHEIGAPGIEVAFASRRGPNAADDDIVARVGASADPSAVRVVTSDRELARRVEELGAEVVGPGALRERMER
ncbi:MAG TPA: NYN domain-containing protein [Capillimicrobium sp.]|nr:NYN domain-containing protein [Capillimicrobium sp.]